MYTKTDILETLTAYWEHAESLGLNVFYIGLKGSQNYNLDDDESDIDANLVFIPTLAQLRNPKPVKFQLSKGEVTCHDIYSFADIVSKGNPQWIEVCHTKYYLGTQLDYFKTFKINPSALKGMVMEKVTAFSKLYPSREKYVKEFGYDPKQLHHIIRLYDSLLNNDPMFKYFGKERKRMLAIKRGAYPGDLKDAEILRDKYVALLADIYEQRKLAYTQQSVDYSVLDPIVRLQFTQEASHECILH